MKKINDLESFYYKGYLIEIKRSSLDNNKKYLYHFDVFDMNYRRPMKYAEYNIISLYVNNAKKEFKILFNRLLEE